jgi:hypothetical protein
MWWLRGGLVALAKGGYLVAVSAGGHAAPATMVGAGSVVEPEDALGVFAAPDEVEVAGGEELGGGFGYGGENLFGGALPPLLFEMQSPAFAGR